MKLLDNDIIVIDIDADIYFIDVSEKPEIISSIEKPEEGYILNHPFIIDDNLYLFKIKSNFFTRYNVFNRDSYIETYDISDANNVKMK